MQEIGKSEVSKTNRNYTISQHCTAFFVYTIVHLKNRNQYIKIFL